MIDLRSDTVTLPSDEMREAAHDAVVGDDMYGNDPTMNELEARAAELVGKEAALFVPSGVVGSQIAARIHADPGQEALVDEKAHVCEWGVSGFAQLSGLQVRAYDAGKHTAPTPTQVHDHAREELLYVAGTGVLCLENTHNACGGVTVPKASIDAVADIVRDLGILAHLDGVRLFNACVAFNEGPTAMVEHVDTVMCCLSKDLGTPAGSVLAGPEAFIEEAVRVRKQFGGSIRQAGLIAVPGLVALDNVNRLADDYADVTVLAGGLDAVSGLPVPTLDANIVVVDSEDAGLTAEEFAELCDDVGVLGSTFSQYHTRFTTNLNVSRADAERTVSFVVDTAESR